MTSHPGDAGGRTSTHGSTSVIHIPSELGHPQHLQHPHQHHLTPSHHHHHLVSRGKDHGEPLEGKEARLILGEGDPRYLHPYSGAEDQRRSREEEKWLALHHQQEATAIAIGSGNKHAELQTRIGVPAPINYNSVEVGEKYQVKIEV